MFDAVRNNRRIIRIVLGIIIVPFALFGVDAYFRNAPGASEVATVGKTKITMQEFEQQLRNQQDRYRSMMGERYDNALFNTEAFRRSVLDNMINQRVLAMYAQEERIQVPAQQLYDTIVSIPAFQENEVFSQARYETALRGQGQSPVMFERLLAQDLGVQQLLGAVTDSAFASKVTAKRYLAAQSETREISEIKFVTADFLKDVTLADSAIRQYYDQNTKGFERPARVRAEYLVLDEAGLLGQTTVTEEQIEQFYQANLSRFKTPEERRARHILFEVKEGAAVEEVAAVQKTADETLAILRKTPERFEELAREKSQDLSSAKAGGDLGFFNKEAMVKSFSDAAFSLKKGEISDLVRSEFGFHIIEMTDSRPETVEPLAKVHDQIATEIRQQEVQRQFPMLATQFANKVYEQPDSLEPIAEELGLKVQKTDWVSLAGGSIGAYRNEKLLNTLFSEDALNGRNNTEAIEVARNVLVSARVAEYEKAETLPFDEVRERIETQLRNEAAAKLAKQKGEALLSDLLAGKEIEQKWGEPRTITRQEPLAQNAKDAIFGVSSQKLPAYAGAELLDDTYALFRIGKVDIVEPEDDDERLKTVGLEAWYNAMDSEVYLNTLKSRYKIQVRAAALVPAQQSE